MGRPPEELEDSFSSYLSPFAPPARRNGSRRTTATSWESGPFVTELADETDGEVPQDELEQDELEDTGFGSLTSAETEDPISAAIGLGRGIVSAVSVGPPSSKADTSVALAPFTYVKRLQIPVTLLNASQNAQALSWNLQRHPGQSGIDPADLRTDIGRYVNLTAIGVAIKAHNALNPSAPIQPGTPPLDAVLVEGIHQFQAKCFFETDQHDGKAGESTLDSLGLVNRTSLNTVDIVNVESRKHLRKPSIAARIPAGFTADTWYDHMVNPTFLGWRFTTGWRRDRNGTPHAGSLRGVHLTFMRKLRQAENALLAMPKFQGMTPVELGGALGFTADSEEHKGARPHEADKSMHTYGLAVDIKYTRNPWARGEDFQKVLKKAALLISGVRLTHRTAGQFWDSLGTDPNLSTAQIHDILTQRNADLRAYFALSRSIPDLKAALDRSRAAGTAGVFRSAQETTDQAARRWKGTISADLTRMRTDITFKPQSRDPGLGFLDLDRDLVIALRDTACLAWGAVDFGPSDEGSGDMMHFDERVCGLGSVLKRVPQRHPCLPCPPATTPPQPSSAPAPVSEQDSFRSPFVAEASTEAQYGAEEVEAAEEFEPEETEHDELEESEDEGETDEVEEQSEGELEGGELGNEYEDQAHDELERDELEDSELEAGSEGYGSEDEASEYFAAEPLADEQSLAEELGVDEAAGATVAYPSGERLNVVAGPAGSNADEYWDPYGTGNPLVDTSAAQAGKRLSANFTVGELARSGSHRFDKARIDPKLVQGLQAIRNRVGKAIRVNSGYRSWGYNQQLYRGRRQTATLSRHCSGQAADIGIAGMSGLDVAKAAIDALGGNIGVGIDKSYAHVDVRGEWARWTYPGLGNAAARSRAVAEIEAYRVARAPAAPASPAQPVAPVAPAAAAGGSRVPAGFRLVKRNGRDAGLGRANGGRLDEVLLSLRQRGSISVTDEEVDTLQRIANVESSGLLNCINTWDSAVVSLGFMQLTLQWGGLQKWIARAPAAFARHGIALDPGRTYIWGTDNRQTAIRGAAGKEELRWNHWAQRFYDAGADQEAIVAQVAEARDVLRKHLDRLKPHIKNVPSGLERFMEHYRRSAHLRGVFHEGVNNRPAYTFRGVASALRKAPAGAATQGFFEILQQEMIAAFGADAEKARRIITKTAAGARLGPGAGAQPAAPVTPRPQPAPLPPAPAAGERASFAIPSHYGYRTSGGPRRKPVYGIVVHTTGSGPATRAPKNAALKRGCQKAIDCALEYYGKGGGGFAHYVIDFDGTVHCTCPETHVAWHAGWTKGTGGREVWRGWSPPDWWARVWGRDKTPLQLIPSDANSPNTRHLGIEILGAANSGRDTDAQYRSLARLVVDIDRRHGLGIDRAPSTKLLGHEDVNPLTIEGGRANTKGGWDPGAHRVQGASPRFSWERLWSEITQARTQPEFMVEPFAGVSEGALEFEEA